MTTTTETANPIEYAERLMALVTARDRRRKPMAVTKDLSDFVGEPVEGATVFVICKDAPSCSGRYANDWTDKAPNPTSHDPVLVASLRLHAHDGKPRGWHAEEDPEIEGRNTVGGDNRTVIHGALFHYLIPRLNQDNAAMFSGRNETKTVHTHIHAEDVPPDSLHAQHAPGMPVDIAVRHSVDLRCKECGDCVPIGDAQELYAFLDRLHSAGTPAVTMQGLRTHFAPDK